MRNTELQLNEHQTYDFACLQIDMAKHSAMRGSNVKKSKFKKDFSEQVKGIVLSHSGFEMSWAGDGGQYLFPNIDDQAYDNAVFAARKILVGLSETSKQLEWVYALNFQLDLRISIDSGTAAYSKDHSVIAGDFLNRLIKAEREIGILNEIVITSNVNNQLIHKLSQEFTHYRHSPELNCELFRSFMTSEPVSTYEDSRRGTTLIQIPATPALHGESSPSRIARIDKPISGALVKPTKNNDVSVEGFALGISSGALYLFTGSNGHYWPSTKLSVDQSTHKWSGSVNVGRDKNGAKITLAVVNTEIENRIEDYINNRAKYNNAGVKDLHLSDVLVEMDIKVDRS